MLIALPISELTPGMFVDSVTKQHEGLNSIKIKTSGLVRNQAIIKRLVTEGVLELLIDFTKGDAAIPDKYKPKSAPPQKSTTSSSKTKPPAVKPAITLEQEFAKASINFEQHNRKLQALYGDVTTGLSVNLKVIDEMANDIVSSVFRNTSAMTILTRIKDKHSYNWRHMINCAIFTAVFVGYKEEAVQQLAMGALLHDLGQAKLPQGIISRPSKLTSSEMDIIKRHVAQGLGLVKGEKGITPLILDMIVNHHERLDGSGYPRGITAENIKKGMNPLMRCVICWLTKSYLMQS